MNARDKIWLSEKLLSIKLTQAYRMGKEQMSEDAFKRWVKQYIENFLRSK